MMTMKSLAVCLAAVLSAASAFADTGKFDPCALLTRREIETVQRDRLSSIKASEPQRDRFAVSQCFFTMATFSKSISLEVTRRRANESPGPREGWKQMFARALEKAKEKEKEREAEEREGKETEREERRGAALRRIEGIGDEAYWDGSSVGGGLYVLAGDTYFRLSIGGPEPVAEKIERLKKLSRGIIRRLG